MSGSWSPAAWSAVSPELMMIDEMSWGMVGKAAELLADKRVQESYLGIA